MKAHLTKFWSYYTLIASIVLPYTPYIDGAITQFLGGHAHLVAGLGGIATFIAHRLPTPASVS